MNNTTKGVIYAIFAMISYASTPTIVKLAYDTGLTTTSMLFCRFALATMMAVASVKMKKQEFPREKTLVRGLLLIAVFAGCSSFLFNIAYRTIHSMIATVISLSYVVIVQAIELVMDRKKRTPAGYLTILITLVGMVIISGVSGNAAIDKMAFFIGIMAAVFYSVQLVIINYGEMKQVTSEVLMVWTNFPVILFAIGSAAASGQSLLPASLLQLFYVVLLSFFNSFLTKLFFFRAVRLIGASKAGMIDMLEPLVSAVLGFALLGERISTNIMVGTLLIMFAIVLTSWKKTKK